MFKLTVINLILTFLIIGSTAKAQHENRKASPKNKKPNVVILLADDLGYRDLSSYGSKEVETPVLDQLAASGMKFTNFYAASGVCSPSRAALLTGRFSLRAGVYSWLDPSQKMHLHRDEISIAEILKGAGYKTAHIGKWHLGYDLVAESGPGPNPHDQGFDYWFATGNNALPTHLNPNNFVRNGKAMGEIKGYSSQIVANEAINWLDNNVKSSKPFYLNLWFHEPHEKVAAPDEFTKRHKHTSTPAYYGSIENMDMNIGRVLKKLDDMNLSENTIVIFMSDNGSKQGKEGSNGELKAAKGTLWEGGIRVPGIIRWPGKVKAGTIEETPAGLVDILPTLTEITGTLIPKDRTIDGTSLTPLFNNKKIARKKPLFWYYNPSRPVCVIREGDWNLIADPVIDVPKDNVFKEEWIGIIKESPLTNFRLFNLKNDISQKNDVSSQHPKLFEALKKKMIELHKEVVTEARDWRTFSWK